VEEIEIKQIGDGLFAGVGLPCANSSSSLMISPSPFGRGRYR